MKKILWASVFGTVTLCGCATPNTAVYINPPIVARPSVTLSAIGYGASSSYQGYTAGQIRLMAIRASKLDAYRALAEQIYGVRITGNTTVSAMTAQNDSFRAYLDSYIRGAKIVSVTPMAEGNYETVVELKIGPSFYDAFSRGRIAAAEISSGCEMRGTVGPGCLITDSR